MDLRAAVRLGLADSNSPAFVSFYDDHRSAQDAVKVAETIADAGVKYAIGHFSSKAAVAASRVYGQHEILFLAPGSSAPSLCGAASPTTVQMFGTDDEQLDCLTNGIQSLSGSAIVLAQVGTYGAELARGLLQRLAPHCSRFSMFYFTNPPKTLPFRIHDDDVIVIFSGRRSLPANGSTACYAKPAARTFCFLTTASRQRSFRTPASQPDVQSPSWRKTTVQMRSSSTRTYAAYRIAQPRCWDACRDLISRPVILVLAL